MVEDQSWIVQLPDLNEALSGVESHLTTQILPGPVAHGNIYFDLTRGIPQSGTNAVRLTR
jgi:hypothetical protein